MKHSLSEMDQRSEKVTVIIPTMARVERSLQLRKAIFSIRASSVEPIWIIVVVNGDRFDATTCGWLREQKDIQLELLHTPSLPSALLRGRELVRTEYFSTLDDDDEYLPESTDKKMLALLADANADLLVGNSYQHLGGVDTLMFDRLSIVPTNPLKYLMEFAWLHNGNALYRTESVGLDYFENINAYSEWTWLAFRLAMDGKKVAVLDQPVFRYNDTAISLSKSDAYLRSHIPLFKRMLDYSLPLDIKKMIHRKMSASHHDASVASKTEGRRLDAWRHHLKSLCMVGGIRYLSYTRHLLM